MRIQTRDRRCVNPFSSQLSYRTTIHDVLLICIPRIIFRIDDCFCSAAWLIGNAVACWSKALHGTYGLYGCAFFSVLSRCSILYCLQRDPCIILVKGQGRPSNCVCSACYKGKLRRTILNVLPLIRNTRNCVVQYFPVSCSPHVNMETRVIILP